MRQEYRTLLGVTVGHGAHDTWFGVAPIMLASVSAQMQLSNSEIGLILLLYQTLGSLSQPFFGRLTERIGGRVLAVGAILWTTTLYSLSLFAPSKELLTLCIFCAGLGSGAWHPQGAANATASGGRWGATAASIFFQGGTLGAALLGAALGGYLLSAYGRPSLLIVSCIIVTLALTVVRSFVPVKLTATPKAMHDARPTGSRRSTLFITVLAFLLVSTALRALTYNSINTYIPKFQQDQGVSPATYGLLLSSFMIATALGGLVGSYLADRVGIRRVLAGSLALGAAFLLLFARLPGLSAYACFAVAGFFIGPSHSLYVVAAQRQFPDRMALISGTLLGFVFVSGAGGAWLLGLLADRVGLGTALSLLPWALLGAAVCGWFGVPRSQGVRIKAEE